MNAQSRLENLPAEIISVIVEYLDLSTLKDISSVSKYLREQCLSYIFCDVSLDFSEESFARLDNIKGSHVRHFVTSLRFKLRKAGAVEHIADFSDSRPASYAEDMQIYVESKHVASHDTTLRAVNQGGLGNAGLQRAIDLLVALPQLKKVTILVQQPGDAAVPLESPLGLFTLCQVRKYKVTQVCNLARGISSSRDQGLDLRDICLSNLSYPAFLTNTERSELTDCLVHLLRDIPHIEITGDGFPIELLCRCSIGLEQLDLTSLKSSYVTLKTFLYSNRQTVRFFKPLNVILTHLPDDRLSSGPLERLLTSV